MIHSRSDQVVASPLQLEKLESPLQLEKLKEEDEKLKNNFNTVVQMVQTSFLNRDVKLYEILTSLQFMNTEEKQMIKNELFEAESLLALFFNFSEIWDYLHPGLLEFIVKRFGTTIDINKVMEYNIDLEKYRKSVKLGEFVKIICNRSKPPLKELSMYVGEDWRYKTLQDLEDVRLQFADKTKCDRLLLRALPKQSHFTIVLRMPSWVQFNLVDWYPVMHTIGVSKVYLNGDCIFESVSLKV